MIDIKSIGQLIQDRTTKEDISHVVNPSIAGGVVRINGQEKKIWITNFDAEGSSIITRDITGAARSTEIGQRVHTYHEYGVNAITVSKMRPVGAKLLRQFSGTFEVGQNLYEVFASYNWGTSPRLINIGTPELHEWKKYVLEEILKYSDEISEEDLKTLEAELERMSSHPGSVYRFIQEQAQLRNNPILDEHQDCAKFSHAFDGITLVIDGGPGTGKTTTLIQRLKYLITPDAINENRDEEGLHPLTKSQYDIINQDRKNWIFFSPTPLLCKYLRSNMDYEGLTHASDQTVVWPEHLKRILRDEYMLAGADNPFDFKKRNERVFKRKTLTLVGEFEAYYLQLLVARITKVLEYNADILPWHATVMLIQRTCKEISEAASYADLIRGLIRLVNLKEENIQNEKSIQEIQAEYNELLKTISLRVFHRIQDNSAVYNELLKIVASWETPEEDSENIDNEESDGADAEVNFASQSRDTRLNTFVRGIVKKLAIKILDSKVSLSTRQAVIFEFIKPFISDSDEERLSTYAYFYHNFVPVKSFQNFMFSGISGAYKKFRTEAIKQPGSLWNQKIIESIVKDNKNRPLYQQEQSLLLGFINNLILKVRSISVRRYDSMTHKYVQAYKNCVRPIIGVDEATDYTLFDYYAIASLRHPVISTVTLSGDPMQCLNEVGVTDWAVLKSRLIFPKLEVFHLITSYRQSPKLIKLADHLFQATMGKASPYECVLRDSAEIPEPIWFDSDDEYEKAQWIVDRILEVKRAYKKVPAIAVFVSSPEQIMPLKEAMEDSERLENEAIDIVDCSNGNIDAKADTIRLFPIDMVKGMEFEVVFFHNIQNISNTKLIDKYLYIGLSRASFYMGVTSSSSLTPKTDEIRILFSDIRSWNPAEDNCDNAYDTSSGL